jgi:hypothetical protein
MTDPESEAMVGIERGMEGKIMVEYLQLAWWAYNLGWDSEYWCIHPSPCWTLNIERPSTRVNNHNLRPEVYLGFTSKSYMINNPFVVLLSGGCWTKTSHGTSATDFYSAWMRYM